MKKQALKDLFQKYYNRFYRFQKRQWKEMWQEFLILAQKTEPKPVKKPQKKKQWATSYDAHGNKIEPDNPDKCPQCRTEINDVNMDLLAEESTKSFRIYECLNCGERIVLKN